MPPKCFTTPAGGPLGVPRIKAQLSKPGRQNPAAKKLGLWEVPNDSQGSHKKSLEGPEDPLVSLWCGPGTPLVLLWIPWGPQGLPWGPWGHQALPWGVLGVAGSPLGSNGSLGSLGGGGRESLTVLAQRSSNTKQERKQKLGKLLQLELHPSFPAIHWCALIVLYRCRGA